MTTTLASSSIQRIKDLSKERNRWLPAAYWATEVMAEGLWQESHPSTGDWIVSAAQAAGYSINAFRRQMHVATFLKSEADASTWKALLDAKVPFGALEALMRLFDLDCEKAKSLLPEVLTGQQTYRSMRLQYQKLAESGVSVSGRKSYVKRARQFADVAVDCIKENTTSFFGDLHVGEWQDFRAVGRSFFYCHPDLISVGWTRDSRQSQTFVFADAYDVKMFGVDDFKPVLNRTLENVTLMDGFFRKTWLIYPAEAKSSQSREQFIVELCQHLQVLNLTSVGVALVEFDTRTCESSNHKFQIHRHPIPNVFPVRKDLLATHIREAG